MLYGQGHGEAGERAICAGLGDYQGLPWWVSVTSLWVFERDGRLIDVQVFKRARA
jgi:hypothetical protein